MRHSELEAYFLGIINLSLPLQSIICAMCLHLPHPCFGLCQKWCFLDDNPCMSNEHLAWIKSTRYLQCTDHCTNSRLAQGLHTTKCLWLTGECITMKDFGTVVNLGDMVCSALWIWDQAAWRKARNVFVLVSAGLATNQASTETPDMCREWGRQKRHGQKGQMYLRLFI